MTEVRLAEEGDAAAIRAIYAPVVENTVVSFEDDPPSEAEMADRVADTLPRYPWVVCECELQDDERSDGSDEKSGEDDEKSDEGTEIAGYAYAGQHRKREAYRWSVDASVYVAPGHRRRGVGSGLYESLFALLRRQRFYNAYAGIALPNKASVALHESLGFEQVGVYESVGYKRGAWHDVGWWQLKLQDGPDGRGGPDEPRPLDELGEQARSEALGVGETVVRT